MRSLCCSNWGCSRSILKKLYTSFIKSKIDYGIHIYSSASTSQLQRLEVVQNSAVRIITGLRRGTQILSLNFEVGFVSINHFIQFILSKFLIKYFNLPNTHMSSKLLKNQWVFLQTISWNTFPHKAPFFIRAIRACNKLNIKIPEMSNHHYYIKPPWFQINLYTNYNFCNIVTKNVNSLVINSFFLDLANTSYQGFIRIFTDGSKQANGEVGSAMFVDTLKLSFGWKLISEHSILAAELFAIYNSLIWVHKNTDYVNFVIFSDSMVSIKLIEGNLKGSYFVMV